MQLGQGEQAWLADLGVYDAISEDFERDHGLKAEWVDVYEIKEEVLSDSILAHLATTAIHARVKNGRVHEVVHRIHQYNSRPLKNQDQVNAVHELGQR